MRKTVRKLVLPVAGLGKRLRPLTLRTPKALVRLNGGPLLEYMLKDAAASGIKEVAVVVSPQHKRAFAAYIEKNRKNFPGIKKIHLRIQRKPLGDGHAVLQAADLFHDEPVAVRFSDDLILDREPTIGSLIRFFNARRAPIMLVQRVPKRDVSRYGVVGVRKTTVHRGNPLPKGSLHELKAFVEKPHPEDAPSNLTVVGGYVLTPQFISHLARHGASLKSNHHDALRLADIFRAIIERGENVYGWQFTGRRLDCGTLEGFYEAERVLREREKRTARKKRL